MKYHAKILYGAEQTQKFINWDKERIIEELLIPFINGQIIYLRKRKIILNLKNVSELKLFETTNKISDGQIDIITDQYNCTKELIDEVKSIHASANSTSLLQKSFAIQKNQVFVIMKFGDKALDSAYDGVIKPTFEEFDIDVIRVDEIPDSGKILDQILQHIAESKFIFSELTDEKPNCYCKLPLISGHLLVDF